MQSDRFRGYSSGVVGVSLIAAIVLAWAMILFSTHDTITALGSTPDHLRTTSNVALKGDRLVNGRNGIAGDATKQVVLPSKDIVAIPIGCDPAFSKIIRYGNFAARCIT